ncbi:virulence factor MviN [Cellulomonas sp. JH27-2]|uniref:murein biosynthesis integral membrane protein MurJ n=1 Tax=Cellulomonas sp. JH27-2 TaxID=2774139 RepID=UPI0017816087|nr:virulence factor MviN [Cellulomonas sp. JH27-2]
MSPAARRAAGGLAGAAAMIAAVTVLSRFLGFGRSLAQLYGVGADMIAGAYTSANMLPNVLFEIAAGGALAGALVPVLAGPIARDLRGDVDRIVSAAVGWTLLVLVPLAGLLALLASPIGTYLAHGDAPKADLIRYFVLVFAVQVPMYGLAVLLYAVLQAHKRFFWPAFAPVMASLVTIAAYLVYGALAGGERSDPTQVANGAIGVLAWGTTLGVAAMCLPMLVPVHRLGVRIRPSLQFPVGVGVRFRALALAGVGSVAAQQLTTLVVLAVANRSGTDALVRDSTVPVYFYAQQVYLLPYAVLVVPLATSTFPRLAARAAAGDTVGFARTSSAVTRGVVAAAGVGGAAVIAAAVPIASVFHAIAREGQDGPVGAQLADALTWMVPGVVGFALLFHASRSLYALERGRAAIVANVTGWGVMSAGVVALAALDWPDGRTVVSIGAASTLGMTVGGVVAAVALVRAAGSDALAGLTRTAVVTVASGVVAALVGRGMADTIQDLGGDGLVTALGAAAGAGLLALVVCALVFAAFDRGTALGVLHAEREPVRPATVPFPDDPE